MTSRVMREVFMPSVPIVMPSEMETVLNSNGVPPAARTPAFTCSARARRWKLQGPISVQVLAMPIKRLFQVLIGKTDRLHHGAGGARLGPSVTTWLWRLPDSMGVKVKPRWRGNRRRARNGMGGTASYWSGK